MEIKTLPHGQVVLPLEVCRRLGIETGTRLEVEIDEETGSIRLRPLYCFSANGKQMELKPARQKNRHKHRK